MKQHPVGLSFIYQYTNVLRFDFDSEYVFCSLLLDVAKHRQIIRKC